MSPSANPVLDEIDRAHANLSPPAKQAISLFQQSQQQPQPTAPEQTPLVSPASRVEAPQSPATPGMTGVHTAGIQTPDVPPSPDMVHKANLARLTTHQIDPVTGTDQANPGVDQVHNRFLHVAGKIGDIAGSVISPRITSMVPGTTLHHNQLVNQAQHAVANDEGQQAAADKSRLENAQATEQESLPELHRTQAELAGEKVGNKNLVDQANLAIRQSDLERKTNQGQSREAVTLAQHGFKRDETGAIVPLPYEEMSGEQQGVHDLKAAQTEVAESTKALREAQTKNIPQAAALAQKRLESAQQAHAIALERLGLSEKQFEMRAHGTEGGEALPGAMIGDDNKPVGTAFQQNVRPTGQERNKADLANSAHQQLTDLKAIVKKRPDIFGPAAGRKTDFTIWMGSEDPDAQQFRAARTIAGDHLAGVFGGRSEAALKALDDAIGQFKDNPAALEAGLDQLDKANAGFQKAGTVKTAGSKAAAGTVPTVPTVSTKAEYDKLPKGAEYIEDGKRYRKP